MTFNLQNSFSGTEESDGFRMSPDQQRKIESALKDWHEAKADELTSVSRRRSAEDQIIEMIKSEGVDVDSDVIIDGKKFSALISSRKKRNFPAQSLSDLISSMGGLSNDDVFNMIKVSAYIHEYSISGAPDNLLSWINKNTEPSKQRKHFSVKKRD